MNIPDYMTVRVKNNPKTIEPKPKAAARRKKLNAAVAEFIAKGGKIKRLGVSER